MNTAIAGSRASAEALSYALSQSSPRVELVTSAILASMPNGKLGDHPVNDLVEYGIAQFTPEIDALIVEIEELRPPYRVDEAGDPIWDQPPYVDLIWAEPTDAEALLSLRSALTELRDDLRSP